MGCSRNDKLRRRGVTDRWVRHGMRGRASNRKIKLTAQDQGIEILKQPEWHDFGPAFASDQLAKYRMPADYWMNLQSAHDRDLGRQPRPRRANSPFQLLPE